MGILDDFINNIKEQRKQYKAEQGKAIEEQAARENAAKVQAAREKAAWEQAAEVKTGKPSDKGYVGGVVDRMKEQRRQYEEAQKKAAEPKAPTAEHRGPIEEFEHRIKEQRQQFEEQKKGAPAEKGTMKTLEEQNVLEVPRTIIQFGRTFTHNPGTPEHLWIDDAARSVYIDDIDAYLKSGGKVEQRGITSAMDPFMYDIYTNKGGPIGQARYYKHENVVISLVPDPFAKYR